MRFSGRALAVAVTLSILLGALLGAAARGGGGVATTTVTVATTVTMDPPAQTRQVTFTETVTETVSAVERACFSRREECDDLIIGLIARARQSIYVAIYILTRDVLAESLIEAKRRGVEVKVVMESREADEQGSDYERLREAGVDVRLDGNPALMHHKFMVIDGEVVVTGSYNWSTAAEERNDENIVVMRDRALAGRFTQEFIRIWNEAAGNH